MKPGLLPDHLSPLVDRLRSGNHDPVSLPDVAALTEVLMRSLESYFSSIDLKVYRECQALADYINEARTEIASLSSNSESDDVEIPRAGQELEAIVNETEAATNTIMNAAEDIMGADTSDTDAYQACVNDAVMKIFEACSFQDITGQRISKVVKTLQQVETRIDGLLNVMDVDTDQNTNQVTSSDDVIDENALLNGPALAGEGIDQAEIDSLLGGAVAPAVESAPAVSPYTQQENIDSGFNAPASEVSTEISAETAEAPAPIATLAEEPVVIKTATEVPAPNTAEPVEAAQDDIDSMFDAPAPEAPAKTTETPAPEVASKLVKEKPIKKEPVGDIQTPKDISTKTTSQDDIDALFN